MRFGSGRVCRPGAFSLLEVIVSLAIIGVLVTYFSVQMVSNAEEEPLERASALLRQSAQRAVREASAFRETYRIIFFPDQFVFGQLSVENLESFDPREEIPGRVRLPEGVRLKLRRFGDTRWVTPSGEEWLFRPAGLCEPIEVRLARGRASVELAFNPLTGRVDREEFFFP